MQFQQGQLLCGDLQDLAAAAEAGLQWCERARQQQQGGSGVHLGAVLVLLRPQAGAAAAAAGVRREDLVV